MHVLYLLLTVVVVVAVLWFGMPWVFETIHEPFQGSQCPSTDTIQVRSTGSSDASDDWASYIERGKQVYNKLGYGESIKPDGERMFKDRITPEGLPGLNADIQKALVNVDILPDTTPIPPSAYPNVTVRRQPTNDMVLQQINSVTARINELIQKENEYLMNSNSEINIDKILDEKNRLNRELQDYTLKSGYLNPYEISVSNISDVSSANWNKLRVQPGYVEERVPPTDLPSKDAERCEAVNIFTTYTAGGEIQDRKRTRTDLCKMLGTRDATTGEYTGLQGELAGCGVCIKDGSPVSKFR